MPQGDIPLHPGCMHWRIKLSCWCALTCTSLSSSMSSYSHGKHHRCLKRWVISHKNPETAGSQSGYGTVTCAPLPQWALFFTLTVTVLWTGEYWWCWDDRWLSLQRALSAPEEKRRSIGLYLDCYQSYLAPKPNPDSRGRLAAITLWGDAQLCHSVNTPHILIAHDQRDTSEDTFQSEWQCFL